MTVHQFLSHFPSAKKTGPREWLVSSPTRRDSDPSLSVKEVDGGKILLNDFGGASTEEVVAAMGLQMSDLMGEDDPQGPRAAPDPSDRSAKPPSEEYHYTDEDGRLAHRTVRFYEWKRGEWKKSFRQHRRTESGWDPKLGDGPLYLYRLPEVRAAVGAGETVLLVEGEKDAETCRARGFTATTSPMGAGKWRPEFSRMLEGARLVVLPDNDGPGERHAEKVRLHAQTYAASVAVVPLPGLPDGGDVTDWFRLGNTADDLRALVTDAAEAPPEPPAPLPPTVLVRRPLYDLPQVSPDAVRAMPSFVRTACGHYRTHAEREVMLNAALAVLSGLLPNVRVEHYDRPYAPHLMLGVVARAGGGKGLLEHAKWLGRETDRSVRTKARMAASLWDMKRGLLKRGEVMPDPRPFEKAYFLPANASKSWLLRAVDACGETAGIFETEIDTLVGANVQEWGDFTDLIRKAFHHEQYAVGRVGGGGGDLLVIDEPMLAMGVSGTWDQFERLFGENRQNGFFSRFCFHVSNVRTGYRSQRPGSAAERRDWFHTASAEVHRMYKALRGRPEDLRVTLSEAQWDLVDAAFEPEYERAQGGPLGTTLPGVVQRHTLMAARLAAVLTVLRAWDHGIPLHDDSHLALRPTDHDLSLALHVASVWYAHAHALLTQLSDGPETAGPLAQVPADALDLYRRLPASFAENDVRDLVAGERPGRALLRDLQRAGLALRQGDRWRPVHHADEPEAFDPDLVTDG